MNRKLNMLIASTVLSLGLSWLAIGLQSNTVTKQSDQLNTTLDRMEQDLGDFNPQTAHEKPAADRALNISQRLRQQSEARKREADSLARVEKLTIHDSYGSTLVSVTPE